MNASLVILAVWIASPFLFVAACMVAERRDRRRKAARRAEVEQQLADVEWLMIVTAVDGLAMHPAIVGHIARQAAVSIEAEWAEIGDAS